MKKMDKIILGSIIAASVVSINYTISSADNLGQDTYITTNRLNMRKGPSTDYVKLGTLNQGEKVVPIEKSEDGKWVKIKYNSEEVWISFEYLQKEEPKDDIKINSKYQLTANLNMRKGPSTDYVKVGLIPTGTTVEPIKVSYDGKWIQVKYNGNTGWIILEYTKKVDKSTSTAPNKVEVGQKYQTTINVNSRKGPSTNYEVVAVLKKGTIVKPVEVVKAGYWAKFELNGEYAYVCTTYLEPVKNQDVDPNPDDEQDQTEKISGRYNTTANLSLRQGPGVNNARILVIPQSSDVEAIEITSDKEWMKVNCNGKTGWVKSEYLEKIQTQTEKVFYTTTTLNFRAGASINSSKIGKIPKNTEVLVLDYNSNKSWAKVKYGNKIGWVSAKYLSDKPLEESDSYWDGVTKANLNLRKSPSTDDVIIVTIPKNSTVKIYKEEDGWLKVKYKSYEGYCSALYVR